MHMLSQCCNSLILTFADSLDLAIFFPTPLMLIDPKCCLEHPTFVMYDNKARLALNLASTLDSSHYSPDLNFLVYNLNFKGNPKSH